MLKRNLLLALGVLLVFAGAGLSLVWLSQTDKPVEPSQPQAAETRRNAVLEAAHPLPAGTLLRLEDLRWREIDAREVQPGFLLRGEVSETEYLGAIAGRNIGGGEAVTAGDFVKPADRRFLSAVLKPHGRAVSIAVDPTQSSSGLVLPGDRVDVILTQTLGSSARDLAHKTVAETVLINVRVIAVDQRLSLQSKPQATEAAQAGEARLPRTVTLEVNEAEAERLFVAAQLGGLQLSVRPLEGAETPAADKRSSAPTWAADVSPALRELSRPLAQASASQSTIEGAIRRPPAQAYSPQAY